MTTSILGTDSAHTNLQTALAVKTANLAKSQTEKEGEMAINLIQSATNFDAIAVPSGSKGVNINVKV